MKRFFSDIQPTVKKETQKVAAATLMGVLLMWSGFAAGHAVLPGKIPLDYTVFLGGIGGGGMAVLNFFLMGLTVQKAAASDEKKTAGKRMKVSYSRRMLLMMGWAAAAAAHPGFSTTAGLMPLLFPGMGIKIAGMIKKIKIGGGGINGIGYFRGKGSV